MQFKEGTRVITADGTEVGTVDRVVIDPGTKEVTHIVVRQGFLFTEDKVIPMDLVVEATGEQVKLRASGDILADLPPFEETHYVAVDEDEARNRYPAALDYPRPVYWYPPIGVTRWGYPSPAYPGYPGYTGQPPVAAETEQNIPEGTVALKEGARVYDVDGEHVGSVERIFTSSDTNQVTHFLISEGLLLKEKKVVPAAWTSTIGEDEVYLMVSSRMLDKLHRYDR